MQSGHESEQRHPLPERVRTARPLPASIRVEKVPVAGAARTGRDQLELAYESGDFRFLAANVSRGNTAREWARSDGWLVTFDRAAVHAAAAGRGNSLRWARLRELAESGQSYALPARERESWEARLEELREELASDRPASREASEALLVLLLVSAIRIAGVSGAAAEHGVVSAVTHLIDQRFREPLRLSHIADAVAVSPTHLRRLVKRATGATVGELVRDRRMDEARRLLKETALPVDAVATASGYRDVTHFRRHFRRIHDQTPGRWRRQARSWRGVAGHR